MNKKDEILCLRFPYLPVEISFRYNTKFKINPFAIISQKGNKQHLYSINPVGELLGLKLGMSLSEAHILCANLITGNYSHETKVSFMINQAKWCSKFTPRISIQKDNMLVLNLRGCTHLFGDIQNIVKKIRNHFKKLNIIISLSLGDNISSTKALTKFNSSSAIKQNNFMKDSYINSNTTMQNNRDFLKKIPIEALELNKKEKEELKYLGIETIYDLQTIPHKDLLTRFGPKLIEKLKKIIGIDPELTLYLKPRNVFSRSISLPEPIGLISDITKLFKKLTTAVCHHLKKFNKGTRTLNVQMSRTDHTQQLIQIKSSEITSKAETFIILFTTKINQIEAGFGIDFIRVFVHKVENLFPIQTHLQINNIKKNSKIRQTLEKEEYKRLISRLSNKIGFDSLIHLHPSQSHIPENNVQKVSAVYCSPKLSWPKSLYERPLLIFKPEQIKIIEYKIFPLLFIWRKKQYSVNVKFGPERIAAEWWLDNPQWRTGLRDYWKIETQCGTRLWLFEAKGAELTGGWYIHGNFI